MSTSNIRFSSAILRLLAVESGEELYNVMAEEAKKLVSSEDAFVLLEGEDMPNRFAAYQSERISLLVDKKKLGELVVFFQEKGELSPEERELLSQYVQIASLLLKKLSGYEAYISYASHELRNPLTSINGYIQLLYAKRKQDDSSQTRWIEELQKETVKFTERVKELLDVQNMRKRR